MTTQKKNLSLIAVKPISTFSMDYSIINQVSPASLIEIFNNFTTVPMDNDANLIVAGSLAHEVDIDCMDQDKIEKLLSKTGIPKSAAKKVYSELLLGKTLIVKH